jgi:hypothetical protein
MDSASGKGDTVPLQVPSTSVGGHREGRPLPKASAVRPGQPQKGRLKRVPPPSTRLGLPCFPIDSSIKPARARHGNHAAVKRENRAGWFLPSPLGGSTPPSSTETATRPQLDRHRRRDELAVPSHRTTDPKVQARGTWCSARVSSGATALLRCDVKANPRGEESPYKGPSTSTHSVRRTSRDLTS